MAYVKPRFSRAIEWVNFPGSGATHLASKSITIENECAGLFRNVPFKSGQRLGVV